jgi:hypothetical protein
VRPGSPAHISLRDVGHERNLCCAQIRACALRVGARANRGGFDAAEQRNFPGCLRAVRAGHLLALCTASGCRQHAVFDRARVLALPCGGELRQVTRQRLVRERARLADARDSELDRRAVLERIRNECVERRVIELAPPIGHRELRAGRRILPYRRERRRLGSLSRHGRAGGQNGRRRHQNSPAEGSQSHHSSLLRKALARP